MFFQRIKFKRTIANYLTDVTPEKLIEETSNSTENDDIILRTDKYRVLKDFYQQLCNGDIQLPQHKKEFLYTKMDEMIKFGVLENEGKDIEYEGERYHYSDLEKYFEVEYDRYLENTQNKLKQL